MPRGRKRVRLTNGNIEAARKKIKNTPKRGRWPKYDQIHIQDVEDYIRLFQHPSDVIEHPKYKNAVFARTLYRGENQVWDPEWNVFLPDKYKILGVIRFFCESWDPNGATPLVDTTCLLRCERTSCPYYRKGFVTETLKNRTFEDDVTAELNKRHNIKQENA